MSPLPILYSFRRCPYAMRARLAIQSAGIRVELREVVLRDKPAQMVEHSPKGTVPVGVLPDGRVIEESLDLMIWALEQRDPEGWLCPEISGLDTAMSLILRADIDFKPCLDRYKYANRYEDVDATIARDRAAGFLMELEQKLVDNRFLFGSRACVADMAIVPFVRQFANVDRHWFDAQDWPNLLLWLSGLLETDRFTAIMAKYPKWQVADPVTIFPEE